MTHIHLRYLYCNAGGCWKTKETKPKRRNKRTDLKIPWQRHIWHFCEAKRREKQMLHHCRSYYRSPTRWRICIEASFTDYKTGTKAILWWRGILTIHWVRKQIGVECLLCVQNCCSLRDTLMNKTRKELGMPSLVKRRIEVGRQTFLFLWNDCHLKERMDSF